MEINIVSIPSNNFITELEEGSPGGHRMVIEYRSDAQTQRQLALSARPESALSAPDPSPDTGFKTSHCAQYFTPASSEARLAALEKELAGMS